MDGNHAKSFLVHRSARCEWYNWSAERRGEATEVRLSFSSSVDMTEECCAEGCDAEEVEENTNSSNVRTFIYGHVIYIIPLVTLATILILKISTNVARTQC